MTALWTLLALSACYWLRESVLVWLAARDIHRLPQLDAPEPVSWPRLSLIVPACNEADTLGPALESRLAEDYPQLEIIVVNDRSTDETGAIADAAAARDGRVRVVHLDSLPQGWLGKLHAMARGTDLAQGQWLLFTDADVHLARGALRKAIAYCEARELDHFSVAPRFGATGFWLQVALSSMGRMLAPSMRVRAIEDPRSAVSFGAGAFTLVRKRALDRTPGLQWLKLEVVDDLALAQMLKRSGARTSIALGEELVTMRCFYPDLRSLMHGMEKNGFAAVGRFSYARVVASFLAALALEFSAWPMLLVTSEPSLQLAAAAVLVLGGLPALIVNRMFRVPLWSALFSAFGTAMMLAFFMRSVWLAARQGGISWRGTLYPLAALREGTRWQSH